MVLRPALQKQAKLLTMDSFSVTDIYRKEYTRNGTKKFKKSYGKLACTSYRKETF